MSFFYDLNKKLNGLRAEDKQITESVAKAAAEVKTPARVTLEESLKQDMKSLMEGTKTQKDFDKLYAKAMSTPEGRKKVAAAEKSKDPHSINKAVGFKESMSEDGTGGANFSGSGSLEEKAGYSAKKAAAGKDIGKPGKNFEKIAKTAGKKYGSKAAGERVAGAVLAKLRAAKESVEEASMEMEAGAGGIHGNMPDPMTAKDQQKKMNPPQSLEEKDQEGEEDIIAYLNRKLAPHDAAMAKEDACAVPYNAGSGKPDAHNGMEFEGNAFTGKLAHTPKGGEFELDGEEYTDTSSLEETVSRKHFQQVADLLKNIPDEAKRKEMAMHHASIFKQQNPRFDMRRFAAAAGVDLEECAMWEELKGNQHKLDVDGDGSIEASDLAALRAGKEVDEGFADMDRWLAQREKEKGTGRFDSRKVSTGTVYTRKPETFDMDDSETDPEATGGAPKRGRGRPTKAKQPERTTAKAWKHKGARVQEEGEEMVDEKAEQGKRHFFDKLAPAAKKVAKVVAKVTGKEDDKAEKAGKKVAKDIEHDDKKDRKEKKADKKEEKVDETTTSGSVATASTKATKGGVVGQGIYDSWEREFETLLAEAVTVKQESMMDENIDGGDVDSITITATGDDVAKLKQALQAMGVSHGADDHAHAEPHGEEPCHSCGGVPCQCDELGAEGGLPGELEIEVVEADAPVTQNDPDYPTNQEYSNDALQYSGGLNKPKATGQTTIPVIASQEERQVAEDQRFFSLVKSILLK